jgi:hypothetical protein
MADVRGQKTEERSQRTEGIEGGIRNVEGRKHRAKGIECGRGNGEYKAWGMGQRVLGIESLALSYF